MATSDRTLKRNRANNARVAAAARASREDLLDRLRDEDRKIVRRLWELRLQVADAPDVELPALTGPWHRAIDEYRSVQWQLGNHRAATRNGNLARDKSEPQMPDRLADAHRLALAAQGIEV